MTQQLKTILVGTDLRAGSEDVLRAGLDIAQAAGGKLYVVHAFSMPLEYFDMPWVSGNANEDLESEEKRLRSELLEKQILDLRMTSNELLGSSLEEGSPDRVLIDKGNELQADLIVVGAGTGGLLDRAFGSTVKRVLSKTTRPVLVVRDSLRVPPERVLLPVDLSPLSTDAFRSGLDVLGQCDPTGNAEAIALFVLDHPEWKSLWGQELREQHEERAAKALHDFVHQLAGNEKRPVRSELVSGFPRKAILEEVERWRPDLVVLGTHGRKGFERLRLGSVAAEVSQRASCSTLVIPANQEPSPKGRPELEKRATIPQATPI